MKIDTRFLSPHPATLAWWARRAECLQCRHAHHHKHGGVSCTAVPGDLDRNGMPATWRHRACIDVRDEGGACGPDALLFVRAKKD